MSPFSTGEEVITPKLSILQGPPSPNGISASSRGLQASGHWARGAPASFLFHWLEMRNRCIFQPCKPIISEFSLSLSFLLASRLIPFRGHLFPVVLVKGSV